MDKLYRKALELREEKHRRHNLARHPDQTLLFKILETPKKFLTIPEKPSFSGKQWQGEKRCH